MQRLVGKRTLVTGGGRGLGRAIALAFASEGARVAVSFNASLREAQETVREAERVGIGALAVQADLTDPIQISDMALKVLKAFGGLDVLVNNAGVFSAAPLLETTDEVWERLLTINLGGPFRCIRAVVPAMLGAHGGAIINLASGGGQHPRPGYDTSPAYAASKAGLIMLSKRLAVELAPSIRVNCLAPGVIDSKPKPMSVAAKQRFAASTPLGRVGQPSDIAQAAIFLASDQAAFITGQVLNVDGGLLM
jgi:3-oxoacyl-[acyl-carrier protein] reductase